MADKGMYTANRALQKRESTLWMPQLLPMSIFLCCDSKSQERIAFTASLPDLKIGRQMVCSAIGWDSVH
jgi:hypothetical protein